MTKPKLYFICEIYCGNIKSKPVFMHTEFIKVTPPIGHEGFNSDSFDDISKDVSENIDHQINNNLLHPSQYKYNKIYKDPIIPIVDRIKATKRKWHKTFIFLKGDNLEEQYKNQRKTRDKKLGYLFDKLYEYRGCANLTRMWNAGLGDPVLLAKYREQRRMSSPDIGKNIESLIQEIQQPNKKGLTNE